MMIAALSTNSHPVVFSTPYCCYGQNQGTRYRVKANIFTEVDFTFLIVLSSHVVLCSGKKMQLMSFDGEIQRRWNFDFDIR